MKSIVIINQSSGYLTIDVCNSFAQKYDEITLLAGEISTFQRPLSPKINIIPICKYDKSSIIKRLFTWIKGSIQIRKYVNNLNKNVEVLYFTNPPMSYIWADKLNNKFGIVEYDIYPDALNNVKCPSFIKKWWIKRNKQIFRKAEAIITLGEGMKKQLSEYCKSDKIKIVHNWGADNEAQVVPISKNKFVRMHQLQEKFVILYSGNIGFTHNVETIINVAEKLKHNTKIAFIIIGEGGKKNFLIKQAKDKGLENILFSDFLPFEDIKYSMSCANLGVVTLTKETANVSVPSKTYNLLTYGIPILNISPSNSELGKFIHDTGCGESFEPEDIDGIINYINSCINSQSKYNHYRLLAKKAGENFSYHNAEEYTKIFE